MGSVKYCRFIIIILLLLFFNIGSVKYCIKIFLLRVNKHQASGVWPRFGCSFTLPKVSQGEDQMHLCLPVKE